MYMYVCVWMCACVYKYLLIYLLMFCFFLLQCNNVILFLTWKKAEYCIVLLVE